MTNQADANTRPPFDAELVAIADYMLDTQLDYQTAYETACCCLLDSIACALMALQQPACTRLLGPVVPGTQVPQGARVPGTDLVMDPVKAAFDFGTLIRWLDFNDTWLAAEWGHPSDNIGAILPLADYLSRRNIQAGKPPILLEKVLQAMIKAYEIQGCLALQNSFNQVGLDHVILVKVASVAASLWLLEGSREQLLTAISQAWLDGHSLRTYRHAPNTGSRKCWAAGDAASRALYLALLALKGEMGYPSALSAPRWGFYDVLFSGNSLRLARPYGVYVLPNILFKVDFATEFHAQTALEAAIQLYPQVNQRLTDISRIVITTQAAAIRIISKTGPLYNPADRDHCLQYIVALGLIFGRLDKDAFSEQSAQDPRIDALRNKMQVQEDPRFSKDYYDPDKRAIANSVQVFFSHGSHTEKVTIEYPIGHPRRRQQALPRLMNKFRQAVAEHFPPAQAQSIYSLCEQPQALMALPVNKLVDALVLSPEKPD